MNNPVEWQSWDVYFGTERMHVSGYTKKTNEADVLQRVKQDFPRHDVTIKKQDADSEPSVTEKNFEIWWANNLKQTNISPYAAAKLTWAFLCIK